MPTESTPPPEDWSGNYINYFTDIEEHFRVQRGTGMFLLSPLDWALIDTWRSGGVPLEAVLQGIDDAFEKWRSRKSRRQLVNSLAYCAQAVAEAAKRAQQPRTATGTPPFTAQELQSHLTMLSRQWRQRPELEVVADALGELASLTSEYERDLEPLEQRLTVLEEKGIAILRAGQSHESLLAIRQALDSELRPYRGKMSAEQIAMLERRYLDSALLKHVSVPRLSLFYL